MKFPTPIHLGPCATRWRLSDLERFEAACSSRSVASLRDALEERYLTVKEVSARYGASVSTVWRWVRESKGGRL